MSEVPPASLPHPQIESQERIAKRAKRWVPSKEDKEAILEAYLQYKGNLTTEQLLQIGDQLGQPSQRIRNYINNHKAYFRVELQKHRSTVKTEMPVGVHADRLEPFATPTSIDGKPAQMIFGYSQTIAAPKDAAVVHAFPGYYPLPSMGQYTIQGGIPQQTLTTGMVPAGMTQQQLQYGIPVSYHPSMAVAYDPSMGQEQMAYAAPQEGEIPQQALPQTEGGEGQTPLSSPPTQTQQLEEEEGNQGAGEKSEDKAQEI